MSRKQLSACCQTNYRSPPPESPNAARSTRTKRRARRFKRHSSKAGTTACAMWFKPDWAMQAPNWQRRRAKPRSSKPARYAKCGKGIKVDSHVGEWTEELAPDKRLPCGQGDCEDRSGSIVRTLSLNETNRHRSGVHSATGNRAVA